MTIQTIAAAETGPTNSYDAGYTDGELDAISKFPARMAMDRASMADDFDLLWAQGYSDGYLHQIEVTYALAQTEQTTPA